MSNVVQKVRALLLTSRTSLSGTRAGYFRTKALGSGYDFDQLIEYSQGADVRRIDWKSSARSNTLLLREYRDEQQRVIHIISDRSASLDYGSQRLLLSQVMEEIGQAFEVIASNTEDAVVHHKADQGLLKALIHCAQRYSRRSMMVVISDFIDKEIEKMIARLAHQHEIILVRLRDVRELELLHAYTHIQCQDSEHALTMTTQRKQDIDAQEWRERQTRFFKRLPLVFVDCYNDNQHLERLVSFVNHYN